MRNVHTWHALAVGLYLVHMYIVHAAEQVHAIQAPHVFCAEFMAGGTLYEAIGKERSGKLGWYSRCDTHCDI